MELQDVNLIIIHCSATPHNMYIGADTIRQWHLDRGWSDIGYHFVILRDGEVEDGRPLSRMGAHVKGRNRNSIGICLVGGDNGTANDTFEDYFTTLQRTSLLNLIHTLETDIAKAQREANSNIWEHIRIAGHNEFARKGCPCFNVPDWLVVNVIEWEDEARADTPSSYDELQGAFAALQEAVQKLGVVITYLEKE